MLNQTKLQRRVEGKDLESVADRVALAHAKLLPARGVRWHANPPLSGKMRAESLQSVILSVGQ